METATSDGAGERGAAGPHANQVAAFGYSERKAAFAARILKCACRAFHDIGASPAMQEIIFWNLYVTRDLDRDEIAERPTDFIEGLEAIYGGAAVVVFEYMMTRALKNEFGLGAAFDKETVKASGFADLLHLLAYSSLEEH